MKSVTTSLAIAVCFAAFSMLVARTRFQSIVSQIELVLSLGLLYASIKFWNHKAQA